MPGRGLGKFTVVPAIWPVNLQTGANAGDFVSMKNWNYCTTVLQIGTNGSSGTCVVTFDKSILVAGDTVALGFAEYLVTAWRLDYDAPVNTSSEKFAVGETVTGAGGGTLVVWADYGNYIIGYTHNDTAFVDNETLTGGTSGRTASADGIEKNEDMLVPRTATSDTFTTQNVANRTYAVEHSAADLVDPYVCLQIDVAQASQASTLGSAYYILSEGRYVGEPMQTAIYD